MPTIPTGYTAAELRAELARQGLTQQELADRVGERQWWVSRRLTGAVALTVDELGRLAAALEVPISQFLPTQERAS